jgi:hypothetical protein
MKRQNKSQMRESVGAGSRTITGPASATLRSEAAAFARKKAIANKPKAVAGNQAGKAAAQRPARSSRVASEVKKLLCRYCGSDDLAPSFLKRRDARCRTCFKQRYGTAARDTKATHTRQAKAK